MFLARSAGFGLPQRRQRILLVASTHGDPRDVIFSQSNQCRGDCARRGSQECYKCFTTDPHYDEPVRMTACVDLLQKRRPPTLHETENLTPRNACRVCIVREDLKSASMLSVADAERLMGFPAGWTSAPKCLVGMGSAKDHTEFTEVDHLKDVSFMVKKPRQNIVRQCKDLLSLHSEIDVPGTYEAMGKYRDGSRDDCERHFTSTRSSLPTIVKTDICSSAKSIERQVSGEGVGEESVMITAEEASRIVCMFLVVTASAVPMARWIGEQLNDPYSKKFHQTQFGIPFHKEIIGGLDAPEGRVWPRAAWNVLPRVGAGSQTEQTVWSGRHALRDSSDMPVCVPYTPLGDFLPHSGVAPSNEAATAYISGLQISHFDIPDFVINILDPSGFATAANAAQRGGEKPHCTDLIRLENLADLASAEPSIISGQGINKDKLPKMDENAGSLNDVMSGFGSVDGTMLRVSDRVSPAEIVNITVVDKSDKGEVAIECDLSGAEDESNRGDPFLAGKPVWAPWKLGKGADHVLWPGISLHREQNKEIIPDAALKMKVKGSSADSHQLVIFFGDRTYQWLPTSSLFDFRDGRFEDRMRQNVKRYAATFQRACEEARVWCRTWQKVKFQNRIEKRLHGEQCDLIDAEGTGTKPQRENIITRCAGQNNSSERHTLDACTFEMLPGQNTAALHRISDSARLPRNASFRSVALTSSLGSSAEPEPCGICRICQSRTTAATCAALSHVKQNIQRHLKCPHIHAVQMARTGHTGALLALRQENALGIRVMLLMDTNGMFSCGKISSFDSTRFSHNIKFDDGVVVTRLMLWDECVRILENQSNPCSHVPLRVSLQAADHFNFGLTCREASEKTNVSGDQEMMQEQNDDEFTTIRKRKSPDTSLDELGSATIRCESCARAHKGIAYCIAHGHNCKSVGKSKSAAPNTNMHNAMFDSKAEAMPRAAARRGGNGKFVVSESVGAALATAGVEIPERCALCIRRKKGLAHCLKKGHIAGTETAAAIIVPGSLARRSNNCASTARKQHNDKFGATPTESQQTTTPASNLLGRNARPKHQDSTGTTQNDAATTQAVAAAALAAAFARAAAKTTARFDVGKLSLG